MFYCKISNQNYDYIGYDLIKQFDCIIFGYNSLGNKVLFSSVSYKPFMLCLDCETVLTYRCINSIQFNCLA